MNKITPINSSICNSSKTMMPTQNYLRMEHHQTFIARELGTFTIDQINKCIQKCIQRKPCPLVNSGICNSSKKMIDTNTKLFGGGASSDFHIARRIGRIHNRSNQCLAQSWAESKGSKSISIDHVNGAYHDHVHNRNYVAH